LFVFFYPEYGTYDALLNARDILIAPNIIIIMLAKINRGLMYLPSAREREEGELEEERIQ
jgi:hypothetical protein